MSLRIKKGDKVLVLAGKDKGKAGKVLHVYPTNNRALVEGVNMMKKHMRKSQQHPQGAIISQEVPIHLSNLSLVCPSTNKQTRFKTSVSADGSKQRISLKSKVAIN